MSSFNMGFEFDKAKIDDEKRQVWGFATVEEPDRQGDIVDYQGSVDAFRKWAGNIREQHDPKKAIGKAVEIIPDPIRKGIWLGAYISKSPDGEGTWTKIKEGILNGFSIKGNINASEPEFRKDDHGFQKRYNRIKAYDLDETSVVDVPACPSSTFALVKSINGMPLATDILNTQWDFPVEPPRLNGTANPFTGLTDSDHSRIADLIAAKIVDAIPVSWNVKKADESVLDAASNGKDKKFVASDADDDDTNDDDKDKAKDDEPDKVEKADPDGHWVTANGHHLFITNRGAVHASGQLEDRGAEGFHRHVGTKLHQAKERNTEDELIMGRHHISRNIDPKRKLSLTAHDVHFESIHNQALSTRRAWKHDNVQRTLGLKKSDEDILHDIIKRGLVKDGTSIPSMMNYQDINTGTTILRLLSDWLSSEQGEASDDDDGDTSTTQLDALRQATKLILQTLESEFDEYYGKPGDDADEGEYAKAAGFLESLVNKIEKQGARHSADDLHDIQKIHKLAVRLGADCGTEGDDAMQKDGTYKPPALRDQARLDGVAGNSWDNSVSNQQGDTSTALMTTGNQTVPHKKVTPQFARDMHELSVAMGAACSNGTDDGVKTMPDVKGNKELSSTDIANYGMKKDAAPKVDDKQGFAQDLHDMAVKFGAHAPSGNAYSNPGYGDITKDDKTPPGNLSVDPAMDDNALDGSTTGRDVADKSDESLQDDPKQVTKSAATAAREIEDMTTEELQALLSTQFSKSAGDLDKVVAAVGALAGHVEKSNSAVDALAKRLEKLEAQPAPTNQVVRQPIEKSADGVVGGNDDRPDYDTMLKSIDGAMDKVTDPREYERLGFQKGYVTTLRDGIFAGWTPPAGRQTARQ